MSEPAPSPIIDSDVPRVKKDIDAYVESGGKLPVFRYNSPLVLITTQGRKSGEWRRTCLIGSRDTGGDGKDVIIVASKGGTPEHHVWYLNLEANARVWVQVGPDTFWATAHTATPEEKPRLWDFMVGLYPDYADYQKKTDRDIPVVILRPALEL